MKKISLYLFVFSAVGFAVGYILTNSVSFEICAQTEYSCRDLYNNIGDPLFYGFGALAIVFLILVFVPQAFSAWKKFAIWFVPLTALLFIFYPEPSSGDLLSPFPEQVFQWVSAFYVVVSAAIIAIAIHKNRT
ncbi:MAG: hypothetical protein WDZ90_00315 [Candidatus Paceibacterota bacterium]